MTDDDDLSISFWCLYNEAYSALKSFGAKKKYKLLDPWIAAACGHATWKDLCAGHTAEDLALLESLIGPHGYAIYMAIEARKQNA